MYPTQLKSSVRVSTRDALVTRLAGFASLVEVGIGKNVAVATQLAAEGRTVIATDITPRTVPPEIEFVQDDITHPTRTVYADADAIYALNLPPELHRPTSDVAQSVGAQFLFTTLGGDPPLVPVRRETLPGETLFIAD